MRTYASQYLSTETAAPRDAAQLWTDLICETFVRLTARQAEDGPFQGSIRREVLGELEFSTVTASAQNVFRTQRYAATASDEFLLFSIQRHGQARICQDGRVAELQPGEIALYDSARPYSLHFDQPFQQLVVQIPKTAVDVDDTRAITAQRHSAGTPGGVIAGLLSSRWGSRSAPAVPRWTPWWITCWAPSRRSSRPRNPTTSSACPISCCVAAPKT